MAENSKIEWTDHTFNPWTGCTKVSPGCDHCYAESWAKRTAHVQWGLGAKRRRTNADTWAMPRKWNERAKAEGRRYRVFCASLADVFDNEVPVDWRADLFRLIADTPNLDWLILTKRVGNAHGMIAEAMAEDDLHRRADMPEWPWPNVWLGATVVNQEEADRDIPKLLATPARVRFLSMEPLLGPVDLTNIGAGQGGLLVGEYHGIDALTPHNRPLRRQIDWVIVGGESGHGARPMHPDWARSLRDQCAESGVPFLFKQWGEHVAGELAPNPAYPDDAGSAWRLDQAGRRWHDLTESTIVRADWVRVKFTKPGKKAAGRLLDGVAHDGFPEVQHA